MNMLGLIHKKRVGKALAEDEIQWFVRSVTAETVPDYQISAFLMAVMFQGLNRAETVALTMAMAASGSQLDLSALDGITVDKHSTGGVGDKTTLVVGPLAAACGLTTAKMSGRGLGHTGGTIDKLESISGYRTAVSPEEFLSAVQRTGLCIIGQSGQLAPADKKLYALRDVTDTVESLPLIAASVMSKKLAAGAQCILLDVKTGSGAFMKEPEQARALAETMVEIGRSAGREVAALTTDMSSPLGYAVGNSLELREAVSILQGEGPKDLRELCIALVSGLLTLAARRSPGIFPEDEDGRRALIARKIEDGSAFDRLCRSVEVLGGDVEQLLHPERLPISPYYKDITADRDGYIVQIDAEAVGMAAVRLGAGRMTLHDSIDHGAGILLRVSNGDFVRKGDAVARLYTSAEARFEETMTMVRKAVILGETPQTPMPVVLDSVGLIQKERKNEREVARNLEIFE